MAFSLYPAAGLPVISLSLTRSSTWPDQDRYHCKPETIRQASGSVRPLHCSSPAAGGRLVNHRLLTRRDRLTRSCTSSSTLRPELTVSHVVHRPPPRACSRTPRGKWLGASSQKNAR